MSDIKKVVVAGGGVLGSQIAFQTAYCGFDVTIWLRSEGSIGRTQPKLDKLKETYLAAIEAMKKAEEMMAGPISMKELKTSNVYFDVLSGIKWMDESR